MMEYQRQPKVAAPPASVTRSPAAKGPASATEARWRRGIEHDISRIMAGLGRSSDSAHGQRTQTTVGRYALRASIRRGPPVAADHQPTASRSRSDAAPGDEYGGEEHQALFDRLGAPPTESVAETDGPAPAEGSVPAAEGPLPGEAGAEAGGAAIQLPDIESPELAEIGKSDAVSTAFTYSGSIARGGAAPAGFGVTRSFSSKLTGVTVTPNSGTFNVVATLEHPITYQVRSGTGPRDQVDVASETDADITDTNYPTVASDLTPNTADLNGRPPCTMFWAEDLTLKHELVHANDDRANGPGAMATVATWLDRRTAATVAGVNALLTRVDLSSTRRPASTAPARRRRRSSRLCEDQSRQSNSLSFPLCA